MHARDLSNNVEYAALAPLTFAPARALFDSFDPDYISKLLVGLGLYAKVPLL